MAQMNCTFLSLKFEASSKERKEQQDQLPRYRRIQLQMLLI